MTTDTRVDAYDRIAKAVADFFDDQELVYATPGTDNHSANFYGDTHVCTLTQADVCDCIKLAFDGWSLHDNDPNGDRLQACIDIVLGDLQFFAPESN